MTTPRYTGVTPRSALLALVSLNVRALTDEALRALAQHSDAEVSALAQTEVEARADGWDATPPPPHAHSLTVCFDRHA